MGIVHIPRTAVAVAKGLVKRRISPLTESEKSVIGVGMSNAPHVYTSRAGAFDVDIMFHMNNASYLTHAELARWEWSAFNGTLSECFRTNSFFIVTASMLRFRREIPPLMKFDIETRLGGIDDRNLWVYQTFHQNNDGNDRGKILAQVFTQAVITNGKKVLNPHEWLAKHIPDAHDDLENLSGASDEVESLFGEKSTRFIHLEESLRKSASLHDEQK